MKKLIFLLSIMCVFCIRASEHEIELSTEHQGSSTSLQLRPPSPTGVLIAQMRDIPQSTPPNLNALAPQGLFNMQIHQQRLDHSQHTHNHFHFNVPDQAVSEQISGNQPTAQTTPAISTLMEMVLQKTQQNQDDVIASQKKLIDYLHSYRYKLHYLAAGAFLGACVCKLSQLMTRK